MIFGVAHLVSHLSRYLTLLPGDVISTGTPPGVGSGVKPEPVFLKPGNVMRVGIRGSASSARRSARPEPTAPASAVRAAPELATARLRLRPRTPDDLEANLAMDLDPEVHRYIFLRGPPGPGGAPRGAARADRVRLARAGRPVGGRVAGRGRAFSAGAALFPLEDSGLIEIGYRYVRAAWGQGVATEAGRAVLDHGFRPWASTRSSRSPAPRTRHRAACSRSSASVMKGARATTAARSRSIGSPGSLIFRATGAGI